MSPKGCIIGSRWRECFRHSHAGTHVHHRTMYQRIVLKNRRGTGELLLLLCDRWHRSSRLTVSHTVTSSFTRHIRVKALFIGRMIPDTSTWARRNCSRDPKKADGGASRPTLRSKKQIHSDPVQWLTLQDSFQSVWRRPTDRRTDDAHIHKWARGNIASNTVGRVATQQRL